MDPAAHRLVVQALTCTLSNCVEWVNEKTANRVRADPANQGLRPWEIIRLLREFVRASDPSCVEQIREEREGWRDRRDYWYKVYCPHRGISSWVVCGIRVARRGSGRSCCRPPQRSSPNVVRRFAMKPYPWKCGTCRNRGLRPVVLDYEAEIGHDGCLYRVTVPALSVLRCEQCGAIVLNDEADQKITAALRVAAGLLSPEEIRRGREALGLSQEQLARYLQVDQETLARWETGGQTPQRSMDRLMRIYFQVPEARRFLEEMAITAADLPQPIPSN